jgi:hypothetical protein
MTIEPLLNTKSICFPWKYRELSLYLKNLWVTTEVRENFWVVIHLLKTVLECPGDPLAVWPPPGVGQTVGLCSRAVWPQPRAVWPLAPPTVKNFQIKVVVTSLTAWSWVALRFNRKVRIIFPTANFWSVGYKCSSISCKISHHFNNILDFWEPSHFSHKHCLIHCGCVRFQCLIWVFLNFVALVILQASIINLLLLKVATS